LGRALSIRGAVAVEETRKMKGLVALLGIVFIVAGVAALMHPDLKMPAKQSVIQIGRQSLKVETRRIVSIPAILSGIVIVSGAGLTVLGLRKT
jgi:hypothetical protein